MTSMLASFATHLGSSMAATAARLKSIVSWFSTSAAALSEQDIKVRDAYDGLSVLERSRLDPVLHSWCQEMSQPASSRCGKRPMPPPRHLDRLRVIVELQDWDHKQPEKKLDSTDEAQTLFADSSLVVLSVCSNDRNELPQSRGCTRSIHCTVDCTRMQLIRLAQHAQVVLIRFHTKAQRLPQDPEDEKQSLASCTET